MVAVIAAVLLDGGDHNGGGAEGGPGQVTAEQVEAEKAKLEIANQYVEQWKLQQAEEAEWRENLGSESGAPGFPHEHPSIYEASPALQNILPWIYDHILTPIGHAAIAVVDSLDSGAPVNYPPTYKPPLSGPRIAGGALQME